MMSERTRKDLPPMATCSLLWWLLVAVLSIGASEACFQLRNGSLTGRSDGDSKCAPQLRLGPLAGAQQVTVLSPHGCNCTLDVYVVTRNGNVASAAATECCGCVKSRLPFTEAPTKRGRSADFSVAYSGWYVPAASQCSCSDDSMSGCTAARRASECYPNQQCLGRLWQREEGIQPALWNVSASAEVQPGCRAGPAGCELHVSISDQWQGDEKATQFYFPTLRVLLRSNKSEIPTQERTLGWSPSNSTTLVFSRVPEGDYKIIVKPLTRNCKRDLMEGCPSRSVWKSVKATPEEQPIRDRPKPAQPQWVYVVAGGAVLVVVALVTVCVVYCTRRRWSPAWRLRAAGPALSGSLEKCAAGPDAVKVVVFQRGGEAEAARRGRQRLVAALRRAGLCPLDMQEPELSRLWHCHGSVGQMLALPQFSSARLLFISDGRPDAAAAAAGPDGSQESDESPESSLSGTETPAARQADLLYEHAVRYVRNSRHGQDYGRVFVCTLRSESAGDLAGLTEGRVFRVAEESDLAFLVSHLRAGRGEPPQTPGGWSDSSGGRLLTRLIASSSSEETV